MLAKYQYMLSMPVSVMGSSNKLESMLDMLLFAHDAETDNEDAEEFSAYSLNTLPTKYKSEEVTLYGVTMTASTLMWIFQMACIFRKRMQINSC